MSGGARSGRVIAVASGKGGVGKTWLSITLAHRFSQLGRKVLLVDGDLGLANIDVQLGLTPQGDLGQVVAGARLLEQAVTRHPAGFDVIAGRSGHLPLAEAGAPVLAGLIRGLRQSSLRYDDVLLDLASGVERAGRRLAAFADTLLVVATDDPTSLTDAYAVLKLHAGDRVAAGSAGEARVVVNLAGSLAAGRQTYAALARACGTFLGAAPRLAGVVRRDERVRAAIRRQSPLLEQAPSCPAAQDVAAIAQSL